MGLFIGVEGRDFSKGEDSVEETEAKSVVVVSFFVVEIVFIFSAVFFLDFIIEVSVWWALEGSIGWSR